MSKDVFVTADPVSLEGFQAVMAPGKFGYSLTAVVDDEMVQKLEDDRTEVLKWCEPKLKNPKRSTLKPTPWEELEPGRHKVKFSWKEESKPPIVDTEGTLVTDEETPLYSGSRVKLAFVQKPYILKDGVTYGTTLKLRGIQIVELGGPGGRGDTPLGADAAAELFGKSQGFVAGDPAQAVSTTVEVEDDF